MKIYTRTGDRGTTALFSGGRVSKNHPRLHAYGTVDELNSNLGLALTWTREIPELAALAEILVKIQTDLFVLGADLATPLDARATVPRVDAALVQWCEEQIDRVFGEVPPLRYFVLPGGTAIASALHIARTVCRRAERFTVESMETEKINEQTVTYLNRLSDLLFALARWANHVQGVDEPIWKPAE